MHYMLYSKPAVINYQVYKGRTKYREILPSNSIYMQNQIASHV